MTGILVDLIFLAAIAYAAYAGTRRGFILIGLELLSFILATIVASLVYVPLGAWLKPVANITYSLAYVTAFVVVWASVEVAASALIRVAVLPRLHRAVQLSPFNQIGGAVLNAFKVTLMIALTLMVLVSIPVPSSVKKPVTSAYISRTILAATSQWQHIIDSTIGRDIGDTINFFTIPSEPESDKRVNLGFSTTQVTIDAADEDKMLGLINKERTSRGLVALTMNAKAREVARTYSRTMFAEGFFSHIDNDGNSPFDRMRAGGVKFAAAGENLALAPTLDLAHQGLMNSPGHRANILSPDYRTVGIGIIDGGVYGLMITQDFTD